MSAFRLTRITITAAAALFLSAAAQASDITGAGATMPYPIYYRWAHAYRKETGIGLSYQAIGSGAGIKQIKARTVTFGATDWPLKPDELKESGLVQFPMVIIAMVLVVNLKGVGPGELVLDGPTIASIYLGDITTWNDPAIKKLNPGWSLPATPIVPVYRADSSGTNLLFSSYLSQESRKFRETVGARTSGPWPVGIGTKGEGTASTTALTDGAIGYMQYAYAKLNKLAYADLINPSGQRVTPSTAAFQAAAANGWQSAPDYHLILTDQPWAASWPITGASFILLDATPSDVKSTIEALKFFDWAYQYGGTAAIELDYAPLPPFLIQSVRSMWKAQIRGVPAPP
jgi:phosphate transport system substrate-binding protein